MENFFSRYNNPLTLMAILFIQVGQLGHPGETPGRRQARDHRERDAADSRLDRDCVYSD